MPTLGSPFRSSGFGADLVGFYRRFFALTGPYWSSENKWTVRLSTLLLVGLTICQLGIALSINFWNEHFFDALEQRALDRFPMLLAAVALIIVANIVVTCLHLWIKRRLQIGWRRWLTHRVLGEWMSHGRQHVLTDLPGEHDNPDGRIAEDIRIATEQAIDFAHSGFHAGQLLIGFTIILWLRSGEITIPVLGAQMTISGHLVWVALLYSLVGAVVAWALGQPLIKAQNRRQTFEARFRFGLAHANEHGAQIAISRGEPNEQRHLRGQFRSAAQAWNRQSASLLHLFSFSSAWWVLNQVVPVLVSTPRYLLGTISLGTMMQTAQAFQQTVGALSWLVDNISGVAAWRASAERVITLHESLVRLIERPEGELRNTIKVEEGAKEALEFQNIVISGMGGTVILPPFSATIFSGERVLITGDPNVAFRLGRAIAGVWSRGTGRIALPNNGPVFFLSRDPYIPLRTLRACLAYPASPHIFSNEDIAEALVRAGLTHLLAELDKPDDWTERLSENERRSLGCARMLLFKPNWIFAEVTADMTDSQARADFVALLKNEFPKAGILLVGNASDFRHAFSRQINLEVGKPATFQEAV